MQIFKLSSFIFSKFISKSIRFSITVSQSFFIASLKSSYFWYAVINCFFSCILYCLYLFFFSHNFFSWDFFFFFFCEISFWQHFYVYIFWMRFFVFFCHWSIYFFSSWLFSLFFADMNASLVFYNCLIRTYLRT